MSSFVQLLGWFLGSFQAYQTTSVRGDLQCLVSALRDGSGEFGCKGFARELVPELGMGFHPVLLWPLSD